MDELKQAWTQFVEHHKETALLSSIQSLLTWDERTGMPVKAADYRAEQVAYCLLYTSPSPRDIS